MRLWVPSSIVFLAVFQLLVVCKSLSADLEPQVEIDKLIQELYLPFHKIPGLGLTILKDNGSTLNISKGYGMRDVENGLAADGHTRFPIGSNTKSFAAVIVVKTLSEKFPTREKFGLDVPIRELIPSYNFTLSDRFRSESTTFRDLLSHKMCLSGSLITLLLGVYKSKEELAFRQRYANESCSFRTSYVYNNEMVAIASEIIAAIANTTFEKMLEDFFVDLEMWDTTIIMDNEDYDKFPNMSRGYYVEKGEIKRHNPKLLDRFAVITGAGGIISTANDMKKYLMFHLNKGKVGDKEIVSEKAMNLLTESSNALKSGSGKFSPNASYEIINSYGLGLINGLQDGWEKVFHNGYATPYYSWMAFFPALKLGIFIVSNGPGLIPAGFGHGYLQTQIFNLITKDTPINSTTINEHLTLLSKALAAAVPPATTPKPDDIVEKMDELNTQNLIGLYGNGLEGEFVVSADSNDTNNNIKISYGKWGQGNLVHQLNASFRIEWTSDFTQDYFAYVGIPTPTVYLHFINDTATINNSVNSTVGLAIVYTKDLTIEKLPVQPWETGSCGPMP